MKKTLWIVLALIVVVGGYAWMSYNSFVSLNTAVDVQWAQVESQFQRRFDLIPNLVASVQGIMKQEKDVFGAISEARTRYAGAQSVNEKAAAASQVESALGRLLVVMENYPQLTSGATVRDLMTQLEGTENRISVERQRYNDAVGVLNVKVQRFPSNIAASIFGFDARELFKAAAGAETAPKVAF
ncbi:MAG: LemA protein [Parcubacteria group bacterium LiPW_15]|nr:MAG: LemA protein [Parcubacteria group bacterium LiPW_15]